MEVELSEQDRPVYFDYAATTPVDPRVVEAMLPYYTSHYGNPNSMYALGREAYKALEDARERVAAAIGASNANEIVFTGSGTEADNAALLGIMARMRKDRKHVIVSAFEHHAVLEPARALAKQGFEVTHVQPNIDGLISVEALRDVLRDDTALVSVMHGNNEIGSVQPIKELAVAAHARGALIHTDAAQTLGKIPFDTGELGVDAASFSGHKIYAPKGVGAMYLKKGTPFEPFIKGGGQEFGKRSGTQNVAGAVAFATALEIMQDDMRVESPRLEALRDRLVRGVLDNIENTVLTADAPQKLPNIVSLLIKGVEGEAMLLQLDGKGIAVSTGSACSSGSLAASHVLLSIGCPPEIAHGSLRLSFGRYSTDQDVDRFLEVFPPIVARLREMSPVYTKMFGVGTS